MDNWSEFNRAWAEYTQEALTTESDFSPAMAERIMKHARLVHGYLGISSETGELLDSLKKVLFYGKPLDNVNVQEEIGDVLWYLAMICDEMDINLAQCLNANIAKLRKRYGDEFSAQKALTRDLDKERETLELHTGSKCKESCTPASPPQASPLIRSSAGFNGA